MLSRRTQWFDDADKLVGIFLSDLFELTFGCAANVLLVLCFYTEPSVTGDR